jgi:hypothetical protein
LGLRHEAYSVRDCFTRYSVHILAASGAIVVAVAKFQIDFYWLGLTAFFPVLMIFHVLAMGTHKYGTSNRLLGYELHIQRTAHYSKRDRCHDEMKKVGWEEAMRAWRVIQPTVWKNLYRYRPASIFGKHVGIIAVKSEICDKISTELKLPEGQRDKYYGFWFDQEMAFSEFQLAHLHYNPGSYLKTVIVMFYAALLMCLALPVIAVIQAWHAPDNFQNSILITAVVSAGVLFSLGRAINIFSRVQILESGLQSIHSHAILWEVIILAHLRVIAQLGFYDDDDAHVPSMHGYTRHIAEQAISIAQSIPNIHKWIDDARLELDSKIRV